MFTLARNTVNLHENPCDFLEEMPIANGERILYDNTTVTNRTGVLHKGDRNDTHEFEL